MKQEFPTECRFFPYGLWCKLTDWLVGNTVGEGEDPWDRLKADIDLTRRGYTIARSPTDLNPNSHPG